MWQLTLKNYIITQFQTKDFRLLTHLFQVNSQVESLKAKRYTLQSSNLTHLSKKNQLPPQLLPNIHAYRKSLTFVTKLSTALNCARLELNALLMWSTSAQKKAGFCTILDLPWKPNLLLLFSTITYWNPETRQLVHKLYTFRLQTIKW